MADRDAEARVSRLADRSRAIDLGCVEVNVRVEIADLWLRHDDAISGIGGRAQRTRKKIR